MSDNPVAQKLLVKQLEKQNLTVTATSDGVQAIAEWEKHEPGHFQVALFDHRELKSAPLRLSELMVCCRYANMRWRGSDHSNSTSGEKAKVENPTS
jgi:CheY-like chemotaxis protein